MGGAFFAIPIKHLGIINGAGKSQGLNLRVVRLIKKAA
jgi:hypothetical protein